MKIVYILGSSSKYEGSNKSFYNMLRGLIEKGIEAVVVLPKYGSMCEYLQKDNIYFKILPYYFSRFPPIRKNKLLKDTLFFIPRLLKYLLTNYTSIQKIYNFLTGNKPDIIHSNVGPIHIGFYLAKKYNIPHIWHLREFQTLDFNIHPFPSLNNYKMKLYSKNNYCIAITKSIFNYFLLNDNAKVIYNGILDITAKKFFDRKEKYFLYAGRLEPNKGIQNLIINFIMFNKINKEYKLYIAGDTNDIEYRNNLYKIVKEYNLENIVIFLGMRNDIYDLMSKATALIVPSLFEGFGRITAEAMFNGCLVIGRNTGGTKEILEAENLGLLYSTDEELVKIMLEVINSGIKNYYPMILKAQEKAINLYSIEQNVNSVFNFYMKVKNRD